MSNVHQGEFYNSLLDFLQKVFVIKITEQGVVSIDSDIAPTSYSLKKNRSDFMKFSKEEALTHFSQSAFSLEYVRSRSYTVYETKKLI